MIRYMVKLVSTYRHHGSSGPKPTKVKSVAASKFNAIMNLKNQAEETKGSSTSKSESGTWHSPMDTSVKPYGTHNGNSHVEVLLEGEITPDNLQEVTNLITNITSNFEVRPSWDVKTQKHLYQDHKQLVTAEFHNRYGSDPSDDKISELLTEYSKKAFYYTSHQLVIIIQSDEELSGARLGKDGMYYCILKTKMIFSKGKQLITASDIRALKDTPSDKVYVRTTMITRIPAKITYNKRSGKYTVIFGDSEFIDEEDDFS